MDIETENILETVRREGACLVNGLLTDDELEQAGQDLYRAFEAAGKGRIVPGERSRLSGPWLLKYPGLARVYGHPRIIELSALITEEPLPFLQEIVANRYIPPHPGVSPHLDEDFGELVPPLMRVTWALFLDDISPESGALTYVPGTHWRNYIDVEFPEKTSPGKEEVQRSEYIPIGLKAGTLILRAADVWHAVRPIHHLRRYITGSYSRRSRTSQWLKENMSSQIEKRKQNPLEEIPAGIRPHFI